MRETPVGVFMRDFRRAVGTQLELRREKKEVCQ